MIRLRLFGRCRIYHDPVSPVLKAPAEIGWDAWFRTIDLVTPQNLKGRELLVRTRGWWTVEPSDVLDIVEAHGKLVVGERGELMVEFADQKPLDVLSTSLSERFGDQVLLDDVLEGLLTVEPGAAVLIDEAQTIFRSKEKLSPELLRWLETHRHRGNDVVLMVQAAAQCTLGVLRLVEVTTKFRRLDRFGLKGRYQAMVRGNPEETGTIRMYTGKYHPTVYAYYSSYSNAAIREQVRTGSIFKSPTVILGVLGLCAAGAWFAGGQWLSGAPVIAAVPHPALAIEIPRAPLKASVSTESPRPDPDDVVPEPVRIVGGMEFDEDEEHSWRWISDTGEIFTEEELMDPAAP